MGSERKSKEEDSRKKRASRTPSEDEGRSKKRRTAEDKETKSKTKKKHKSSKHPSDKELKQDTKHKDKSHKRDRHSKIQIEEISNEDYFSKNNEFATWLKEEKNTFFSDLSSTSAREMFLKFVEKWNKGKLELRYYEGIGTAPRTAHNWGIKK